MKLKRIIALLCALVLCLCLCGCDPDLDQLRETRGNYTADGDIVLNGVTYKPVWSPLLDPLSVYQYDEVVHVAEEGVPLLMVLMESKETLYFSEDGNFLCPMYYWYAEDRPYVREDLYDEVLAQIEAEPELNTYRYTTYDETYKVEGFIMTAEQAEMLRTIWSEAEWEFGGGDEVLEDLNYEQLEVVPCTANGWFADTENPISVYWVPGKSSYVLTSTGTNLVAYVPLEYVTEFEDVFRTAIDYAEARMDKGTMFPEYTY